MKLSLSKLEMSAIVRMAKIMALADGVVKEEEMKLIASQLHVFGVPDDDVCTILEISDSMQPSEATSIINSMTSEQKKYVCAYLGVMIAIDGDTDDKETALWGLISTMCNLPTMTIAEALDIMANM